jgi:hypothetical protein
MDETQPMMGSLARFQRRNGLALVSVPPITERY